MISVQGSTRVLHGPPPRRKARAKLSASGPGSSIDGQSDATPASHAAGVEPEPTYFTTVASSSDDRPKGTGTGIENTSTWPCHGTWCQGERRQHLLLCMTSMKHFGNPYTHICSRPEIWLMKKADPWARDDETGEIVALEPEPLEPPQRILDAGVDGLTEAELQMVDPELLEDVSDEEEEKDEEEQEDEEGEEDNDDEKDQPAAAAAAAPQKTGPGSSADEHKEISGAGRE